MASAVTSSILLSTKAGLGPLCLLLLKVPTTLLHPKEHQGP